jgi:hypothetical protein
MENLDTPEENHVEHRRLNLIEEALKLLWIEIYQQQETLEQP